MFFYPRPRVDIAEVPAAAHAGAVLLTGTIHATGLAPSLREALDPWTKPLAEHHASKVLLDLAMTLAIGGEHASDTDLLRCEPGLFGDVASAPTISRNLTTLAEDAPAVVEAISQARRIARERAWALAGDHSPVRRLSARNPLVIDLDATLINVHSEKEQAAPTFKRGFGYHPLCAFLDHGSEGTGEPLAIHLRPGNAGSNTAADHITITRQALAQLPAGLLSSGGRGSKKVLIRTDGAGGTKDFVKWLTGQRLAYSVGFTLPANTPDLLERIDEAKTWTPAYDTDTDGIRDGAWVAELTGLLDLQGWPPGMRVIVRKERPHPGAQLRITDHEGMRITAFATNTPRGQLPVLELRHRRRARCEDRIRNAKDMGLMKFPLQGFAQNQVWCQIIQLASELVAWMQTIALTGHDARKWEPKRLRARLFEIPATLVRRSRHNLLHLAQHAPEARTVLTGINRLRTAVAQT
ncbi:MAG: IS1380 family transposase [Brachybacterium sp.]|nr:IS1380 family transposase [Brachybacterium alimentarium]MDN6303843.1 IS1380 family transposase [Brachybacterium sp.]MDN6330872.1 IS1380 family transposase [Brachybacterium sp.]MDN6401011.1 IS1380 family transposase [Brachybacterium sp.]